MSSRETVGQTPPPRSIYVCLNGVTESDVSVRNNVELLDYILSRSVDLGPGTTSESTEKILRDHFDVYHDFVPDHSKARSAYKPRKSATESGMYIPGFHREISMPKVEVTDVMIKAMKGGAPLRKRTDAESKSVVVGENIDVPIQTLVVPKTQELQKSLYLRTVDVKGEIGPSYYALTPEELSYLIEDSKSSEFNVTLTKKSVKLVSRLPLKFEEPLPVPKPKEESEKSSSKKKESATPKSPETEGNEGEEDTDDDDTVVLSTQAETQRKKGRDLASRARGEGEEDSSLKKRVVTDEQREKRKARMKKNYEEYLKKKAHIAKDEKKWATVGEYLQNYSEKSRRLIVPADVISWQYNSPYARSA